MIVDTKTGDRLGRIILERDTQTRISCFLIGIKQVNVCVLSRIEFQPMAWEPFALLHGQLCRELELIGLLQRVTDWSMNPTVYVRAGLSNMQHLGDLHFIRFLLMPVAMDTQLYRYLALTHALYAHMRFIPLLPLDIPLEHRFLVFLQTLETIHGQQMQAQMTLLQKLPVPLSDEERERIIGEEGRRVREVFRRFAEEIVGD
ncbi:MAG TPA: hypothetical protein PLR20_04900 [Syntrophales bacterium]|nr:hypothetical protein [Syntrophales bacterium]HPI56852.1 hypothetical protein [Syntrophales bacterium]HPN24323.1 hypothetical protein [Syntrophales bacterium]HQM28675.1 hypothetical protein [Syntrophales bacterium]